MSGVGPQPLQPRGDFPAGFIRGHHGTAANRLTERGVGRFRPVGRPAHRVHQAAGRDGQPETLAEQGRDLAEWQSQLFVEHDGEGDGGGPQLRGGRPEGVGGLQRMAALDAPTAVCAVPNGDVKGADARTDHGQIFLKLGRVTHQRDRSTARAGRNGASVRLIDVRRHGAMGPSAVRQTGFPSRAAGWTAWRASRKGRGLAMQRAPGVIEVVFEAVDFLPQLVSLLPIAIPVSVRPLMLPAQLLNLTALPVDFALLSFELRNQLFARRRAPRDSHASLMPRLDHAYKGKLRHSRRSDDGSERITR